MRCLLALGVLLGGLLAAPAAMAQSQRGELRVLYRGEAIGREVFEISGTSSELHARGDITYQLNEHKMRQTTDLLLGGDAAPRRYEWKLEEPRQSWLRPSTFTRIPGRRLRLRSTKAVMSSSSSVRTVRRWLPFISDTLSTPPSARKASASQDTAFRGISSGAASRMTTPRRKAPSAGRRERCSWVKNRMISRASTP